MIYPIEHPSCSICTSDYGDDVVPRLLPACGHTFCQLCISKMTKESQSYGPKFKCPFDGSFSDFKNVETLQKNFEVIRIVEEIKEGQSNSRGDQRRTRREADSPPGYIPINPCHENPRHDAEVHCEECRAELCRSCFEKIHEIRIFKCHEAIPLRKGKTEKVNCPMHRSQEATSCCTQHPCSAKFPIGCSECFKTGEHKGHIHESRISKKVAGSVTSFKTSTLWKKAPSPPRRIWSVRSLPFESPPSPPPSIRNLRLSDANTIGGPSVNSGFSRRSTYIPQSRLSPNHHSPSPSFRSPFIPDANTIRGPSVDSGSAPRRKCILLRPVPPPRRLSPPPSIRHSRLSDANTINGPSANSGFHPRWRHMFRPVPSLSPSPPPFPRHRRLPPPPSISPPLIPSECRDPFVNSPSEDRLSEDAASEYLVPNERSLERERTINALFNKLYNP